METNQIRSCMRRCKISKYTLGHISNNLSHWLCKITLGNKTNNFIIPINTNILLYKQHLRFVFGQEADITFKPIIDSL